MIFSTTLELIKKYHKTLLLCIIIMVLSLMNPSDLNCKNIMRIKHIDKIVHFLMYASLCGCLNMENIIHNNDKSRKTWKTIAIIVFPILIGISMEIFQQYFTRSRSGNFDDAIANTIGTLCGFGISKLCVKAKFVRAVMKWPVE